MAVRKCASMNFLVFAVVALLLITFLIFTSHGIWDLKNTTLNILGVDHRIVSSPKNRNKNNNVITVDHMSMTSEISPNLTTCHKSYGRSDLLINCCPPLSDEATSIPIDFVFPDLTKNPQLRVRRPVHLLDKDYIAKYTKALTIMKSLPHSDPRSFSRQAQLHCTFCTNAYNQKHSSASINVHRQWLFYPFHRMYLYFYERILGNLIGDDTFALPFWNWDNPDSMTFPNMFLHGPFADSQRELTHLNHIIDLDYGNEAKTISRGKEQVNTNLALMYNQVIAAAKKPELFMGCSMYPGDDGFCDGPGTVEFAPHNSVHMWVGRDSNPDKEDMGSFYSAGWDPCFYSHHANIDRIWDIWREIHGICLPIRDNVWLNSYFYFYNENLQLVKIKVSDVVNTTKLGYTYEMTNDAWLNKRPKPFVLPKIAKYTLKTRENNYSESINVRFVSNKLEGRSLETPITVKVYRPKPYRNKNEIKEEEEVLVVYGINVNGNVKVKFDVYVNLINETNVGPVYREFAGTFIHLHESMKRPTITGENKKSIMKLGISELLNDLEADKDESIWVTLFPRTKSCANTTFDGIRIDYIK